ncbi:phosphoprotein phosphatase [Massilia sp. CCM 8733]|uniref:Phosphoprotein phosphatase n=1 Tax=Massilia mucilaginosa TaxID=2609282 RepID=A0ABX0P3G6_9BURK|nr:HAD family hydrolase [Massilia mucilaginosa]NHZ93583.1 phosphoprotein phosphatase [Massilia mucilaginosa]
MQAEPRRLLIFDLDETLVHASEFALAHPCDFDVAPYLVYQRPFARELIALAATRFDLAVWSSSSAAYVAAVVERLFAGVPLRFAWSVERCVQRVDARSNSYVYIKDLRKARKFGYTLERMTIIDDSPEKICRQPRCHLPVAPFIGAPDDVALLALRQVLRLG